MLFYKKNSSTSSRRRSKSNSGCCCSCFSSNKNDSNGSGVTVVVSSNSSSDTSCGHGKQRLRGRGRGRRKKRDPARGLPSSILSRRPLQLFATGLQIAVTLLVARGIGKRKWGQGAHRLATPTHPHVEYSTLLVIVTRTTKRGAFRGLVSCMRFAVGRIGGAFLWPGAPRPP